MGFPGEPVPTSIAAPLGGRVPATDSEDVGSLSDELAPVVGVKLGATDRSADVAVLDASEPTVVAAGSRVAD